MVIGGLGQGKSTFMNRLAGVADSAEIFVSSNKPKSCTQEAHTEEISYKGSTVTLTDTPGLFDMNMKFPIWLARYA